jgi:tetratricopeptide (TPR) repeat protein
MPTRAYAISFSLLALAAAVFCFLPLLNLLGYESAAGFGILGGIAATGLTLHAVNRGLVDGPLDSERTSSPLADFLILLVRHELLLALPAIILSLNAMRVINCSYGMGVGFWLAIPVPAIFMGQMLAWVACAVVPGRIRLQMLCCVVAIVGSVIAVAAHLAFEPPIVGHQVFMGYFSGSIYDEALTLPTSLVWYRAMHLAASVAVLAAIEGVWRRRRGMHTHWAILVALIAALSFGAMWLNRHDLGIAIDAEYVQAELGGRMETEHFIIYYPQTTEFIEARERLAEDHEFRYAEMKEFFGTDPARDEKIESYVYPNREEKGRLMGGRRTLVSKLWLHEMHILWRGYGDHKLAHELAHIFTEPFGAGPLRLSMQAGIGVNMGLVEGVATAADWPVGELSPHQASAALRRLELAPDISGIVGATGFWAQSSGRAYILVGSFVRYLVDTYGVEPFKKAYPTGDFEAAYSTSSDALVQEWEQFVDGIELSEDDMALARYLYERPSIFEKVCARQIAEMTVDARAAASRGDVGQVREIYEKILGYDPDNIRYRIGYAHVLTEARQYEQALQLVEEMLAETHPPVVRAQLLSLRGDLAWRRARAGEMAGAKRLERASKAYRQCLDLGISSDARRLLQVKIGALARPESRGRSLAFEYLIGQNPNAIAFYYPMQWYLENPQDALAAYLVGRRLWNAHQWEQARSYLEQAYRGAQEGVLRGEALRMLAQTEYFLGRLERAKDYFSRLALSPQSSHAADAREWLDRIAWKRGNRLGTR